MMMNLNSKILLMILITMVLVNIPYPVYAQDVSGATASAYGIKETKSLDLYFGFEPSISANTWYNETLNFTPIDRVDYIRTANIRIIEEQVGNPTLTVMVNDTACETPSITAKVGKVQYVADFECRNIINESGIYKVSFMGSIAVDNAHFRLYVTFDNDPDFTLSALKQLEFERSWELISNHDYCLNSTHLGRDLLYQYIINNVTYNITRSETVTCNYGCDLKRNECIPDPVTRYFWIIVIVIGLILLILLIWRLA